MVVALDLVLVHGAGSSGAAAWRRPWAADGHALDLTGTRDVRERAEIVAAATTDASIVVAHSHGAVPAVLALAIAAPRHLLLVEPALYDVARGHPAVEAHITGIERAHRALADDGVEGFWRVVRPIMFGGPFDASRWAAERETATWFADVQLPWGHGIVADDVRGVPTTVVTGAWNAEYDAIADALVVAGARRAVLAGAGHRPHDLPAFGRVLDRLVD